MPKEKIMTGGFVLDAAISFCSSLNYFILLINITGYSTLEFGADPAEGGLAAGIYVIGGLLSRILIGKYTELIGRRRLLLASLTLALVMSAAYFFVTSMAMLYVVRLVHGIAYGLANNCTFDIAAKLVPFSRRGEGLGYFSLGSTVACAIGPLVGMHLGNSGDYGAMFAVGCAIYALALVMAFFVKVPEETLSVEQVEEARSFKLSNLFQFSALPLALTVMVFYFSYSGVLSFISDYSKEIDMVEAASYFYLVVAAGTLVSRLGAGRIYDERGANIIMIPANVGFILGMLVFATTSNPILFLASGFFIGIGMSAEFFIIQSIVVSKSPPRRYGVTTSTLSALEDLGTGMGPTILGLLIISCGYREMYMICVAIAAVSLLMYWVIHGRVDGNKPGRIASEESRNLE